MPITKVVFNRPAPAALAPAQLGETRNCRRKNLAWPLSLAATAKSGGQQRIFMHFERRSLIKGNALSRTYSPRTLPKLHGK